MGLAQIEGSRADEVADIFDEEQPHPLLGQRVHGGGHHPGIEMADGSGGDLDYRRTARTQRLGIRLGFQIAHHHRAADARLQPLQRRPQERGFARAGGRNEIESDDTPRLECLAVALRFALVGRKDGLRVVSNMAVPAHRAVLRAVSVPIGVRCMGMLMVGMHRIVVMVRVTCARAGSGVHMEMIVLVAAAVVAHGQAIVVGSGIHGLNPGNKQLPTGPHQLQRPAALRTSEIHAIQFEFAADGTVKIPGLGL